MSKPQNQLLAWYASLRPLRLDLVGDYAGNELFLVEGDSLVLHVLSDERIDMQDGLQLLHAIYMLETFLQNLRCRGANFDIVFFEEHKPLCFLSYLYPDKLYWRFQLVRSCVIRHLESISTQSGIQLYEFSDIDSPHFKEYLKDRPPYFAMCHDGAVVHKGGKSVNDQTRADVALQVAFRTFIWEILNLGCNCAMVHETNIKGSKIMTSVLEGQKLSLFSEGDILKLRQLKKDSIKFLLSDMEVPLPEHVNGTSTNMLSTISLDEPVQTRADLTLVILSMMAECEKELVTQFGYYFILHTILLDELPLEDRALSAVEFEHKSNALGAERFLNIFSYLTASYLHDYSHKDQISNLPLHDILDGRLFKHVIAGWNNEYVTRHAVVTDKLVDALQSTSGLVLQRESSRSTEACIHAAGQVSRVSKGLLPFENALFEEQLQTIMITTDELIMPIDETQHRPAPEITHWHNSRMLEKSVKKSYWGLRSNQIYEFQMAKYAKSLSGGIDTAQLITVVHNSNVAENVTKSQISYKQKSGKKESTAMKGSVSKKADILRAENEVKLPDKKRTEAMKSWSSFRNLVESEKDSFLVLNRLSDYQKKINHTITPYTYLETQVYRLHVLVKIWTDLCYSNKRISHYNVCALIFDEARLIMRSEVITKDIKYIIDKVFVDLLGFEKLVPSSTTIADTKLSFNGPYMDRNMDSKPDPRVKFEPDAWQRQVLDKLDKNQSVFVVAPTSAGKTFISFYAMEQVLRRNDEDVLVYVAPTKALVNQIAAEIQRRFKKQYPGTGKSVWAIHTRDYRIHNPTGCQILVTVPHILQILLLAPQNAKAWSPKVKRIIFDEVHSIGQAEDGVVWEQLLLLAPCPIIALSATVGNPAEFRDWLEASQQANGTKLTMVEHLHRYSDLRKFSYTPPSSYTFAGLAKKDDYGDLEEDSSFRNIHPITSLVDAGRRGLPADLALEPRDCLKLYQAMVKVQVSKYPVPQPLHPDRWFSPGSAIRKERVIQWEAALKKALVEWMKMEDSPFRKVVEALAVGSSASWVESKMNTSPVLSSEAEACGPESDSEDSTDSTIDDDQDTYAGIEQTSLSLLSKLHAQNALPAILFSHDRTLCEKVCHEVLTQLVDSERKWRESSTTWARKMQKWEEYKKQKSRPRKEPKKTKVGRKEDRDDMMIDDRQVERSSLASFRPEDPDERFSFVGSVNHDVENELDDLRKSEVPEMFIEALKRGVGVHHAGLSRKLRECVERLFRMGYLRVVIATGTLALGINMPCKTVCFIGDSVYLTALNYRQAAGRAGRRGFDLLGNVVFHGISVEKVKRLMSSRLPSLVGHFPINTSLVLRLFTLLHGSENSEYAISAITNLLCQSRLCLGGSSFKEQVLHHLRFSIEYLRRQHLINISGMPVDFAACISHLYYTGNSAFAFHALLRSGFFDKLCSSIRKSPTQTGERLVLVLAHIFSRRQIPKSRGDYQNDIIKRSSSVVYLPDMPNEALQILTKHNGETLETFKTYVTTFAKQYCGDKRDNTLPLSKINVGSPNPPTSVDVKARSAFVALSGHDDNFATVSDLVETCRSGIFLEGDSIPILDFGEMTYNAYLLDFYKHGALRPLVEANGLRRNDIWYMLNDFSMILATIVTSLKNYMGQKDMDDDQELGIVYSKEEAKDADQINTTDGVDTTSGIEINDGEGDVALKRVLAAFAHVQTVFDAKLRAIGATKKFVKKKATKPRIRV